MLLMLNGFQLALVRCHGLQLYWTIGSEDLSKKFRTLLYLYHDGMIRRPNYEIVAAVIVER